MFKRILTIAILALPLSAWSAVQNISAQGGEVDFLAVGKPSFIKIHGVGGAPTGQLSLDGSKVDGKFEFDVGSLGTGIETRDDHMKKKYLEVEKYPKASLALQSASPVTGWSVSKPKLSDADFSGVLTLHGVSNPVTGKFNVSDSGKVEVAFKVKLTDFGVAIPTFAGITVADEVEIQVKIDRLQ